MPPPGGSVRPVESWSHPYHYAVDWDRNVADPLEFYLIVDRGSYATDGPWGHYFRVP